MATDARGPPWAGQTLGTPYKERSCVPETPCAGAASAVKWLRFFYFFGDDLGISLNAPVEVFVRGNWSRGKNRMRRGRQKCKTKADFRSRDPSILIFMPYAAKRPVISIAVSSRAERTGAKDPGKQA